MDHGLGGHQLSKETFSHAGFFAITKKAAREPSKTHFANSAKKPLHAQVSSHQKAQLSTRTFEHAGHRLCKETFAHAGFFDTRTRHTQTHTQASNQLLFSLSFGSA
jgi:hypothetical protein